MMKPMAKADLEGWYKRARSFREKAERKFIMDLAARNLLTVRKDDRTNRAQVTVTPTGMALLREHGVTGDLAKSFDM